MQHRQRFGGLCGPPQHARRGKAGLTFVGEQLREVDAVDPVEHEHMPSLVEQVVTRVGDCRMGRKQEQCARFEQQVFSLAIDKLPPLILARRDVRGACRRPSRPSLRRRDRSSRSARSDRRYVAQPRSSRMCWLSRLSRMSASVTTPASSAASRATDVAPGLRCRTCRPGSGGVV